MAQFAACTQNMAEHALPQTCCHAPVLAHLMVSVMTCVQSSGVSISEVSAWKQYKAMSTFRNQCVSNKRDNFQQGTRSTVQRLGESFASGLRQVSNRQTLKRFFDRLQQIRHHMKSYDMIRHASQANKQSNKHSTYNNSIYSISIAYSMCIC